MQKLTHKVVFFFAFLYKYSVKNAFLVGFGEQFGEQNHPKSLTRDSCVVYQGRVFQQTERVRAEYSKGQQLMRQWNAEIVEYERMKAYYAEQGQEPPYKSLGAFRREARKPREKQSQIMRQLHNRDRDVEEYKKIKSTLGANKVPETFDKFKHIKYNNIEQYSLIRREERMRRESVSQPKIPNANQANMPKEKTFGYVLNPEHDVGKHKARVIKSALGYTQEDYAEFTEQVIENLAYYKATEKESTEYGRKFLVRMILTGKTGKRLLIETIWQIDKTVNVPRFITITFPK